MSSRRTSQTRVAIILALSVVMCSDAGFALICSQRMACHAGSSNLGKPTPADSQVQSMPCCPGSEMAMQCASPAMNCCVLEQGGTQPAVVVSKANKARAKSALSLSRATVPSVTPTAERLIDVSRSDASIYIKPVTQKKTDLRI